MIPRYSHPGVAALWSTASTYEQWRHVAVLAFCHQYDNGVIPRDEHLDCLRKEIVMWSANCLIDDEVVERIGKIEERTRHDVAAFLEWMRGEIDQVIPNGGRWVAYGLTSSDLVDSALGMRFRDARYELTDAFSNLMSVFTALTLDDTPIIGRTHGVTAELMTLRARAWHWMTLLAWPGKDLLSNTRRMALVKLSGPVGTFAHNPPVIEAQVAIDMDMQPMGAGASQIIPRSALAAWANSAAQVVEALAKVATDIRLMNLLGEATIPFTDGQVGSSAMAHKRNPIRAEQIEGMSRMARGYALMLSSVDSWFERDIAHSSVERVAVPDLWHVLLHVIQQATTMLSTLRLDDRAIETKIDQAGVDPLVVELTLEAINRGMAWEDARAWATSRQLRSTTDTAQRAMRNYPVGRQS